MMGSSVLFIVLWFVACITTLPVSSTPSNEASKEEGWSKEAILGLVAVLVVIVSFIAGLSTKRVCR